MSLDQVQEQNSAYIKGMSGATHLVDRSYDAGLITLELCSSEIARMVQEFENELKVDESSRTKSHHEDNANFQKRFSQDVANLYNSMTCNPFVI